jgi:hypothetical protein
VNSGKPDLNQVLAIITFVNLVLVRKGGKEVQLLKQWLGAAKELKRKIHMLIENNK